MLLRALPFLRGGWAVSCRRVFFLFLFHKKGVFLFLFRKRGQARVNGSTDTAYCMRHAAPAMAARPVARPRQATVVGATRRLRNTAAILGKIQVQLRTSDLLQTV